MHASSRRDAGFRGFTLIELLVVISIIALLIGILLPVLGTARAAGQAAVCLANLRSAGQGLYTYSADNKDYYPGPNTSGASMTNSSGLSNAQKAALAGSSGEAPLQSGDWISPTMGFGLGLPSDPEDRMVRIFEHDFRCPANKVNYSGLFSGGNIYTALPNAKLPVSSYSVNMVWQYRKDGVSNQDYADGDGLTQLTELNSLYGTGFRTEGVKNASSKVYASEGNRFLQAPMSAEGDVTFNGAAHSFSGDNFSNNGWIFTGGGGNPYKWGTGSSSTNSVNIKDVTPGSIANAFRHPSLSINMLKFDGSAQGLPVQEAVDISLHVPSGVTLTGTQNTADPNDNNGQVVY